jgi:Ca-activated chloride channel homolog
MEMNARYTKILTIILLFNIAVAACATRQPTPAPIAIYEAPNTPSEAALPAAQPTQAPMALEAPRATAALLPGNPPPSDNSFQNYGINPFVDTREDHLSTFGLDVDTASYTVARRYVMDGNLPPADSVRVEEFVNYFDQDYANPEGIAFGIYADGAPSPFNYDGTYIMRFGIQGYEIPDRERKPLSLTIVIDTSGSMSMENRLGLVKDSLKMLVDRLHPNDSIALVEYGTDARIVLNPTSMEDSKYIMDAIYRLQPGGTTNAESGLRVGYQLAAQAYRQDYNNRVILLSDGVANTGATSPDQLISMIKEYSNSGITLTTIGVGMGNFNDVLLEKLADNGNGNYAYIDDIDEARRLFVEQLTSTLETIALNAKIQVDFNPEVIARYRLMGYENRAVADQDFRNDQVDAGEINAGHSATALYAVQLYPGAQGRIATVQLRWEDPDAHDVREINGNFNTWDLATSFESGSPRYQLAVIVAQYAELLRLSPWSNDTTIVEILNHAVRLAGLLPDDPSVAEFASLVSRASQISAFINR